MKRMLHFFVCLTLILGMCSGVSYAAPSWPNQVNISAEGGIVIDANSGAVLYGQNIHEAYFPASITKILTALIVIENCDLDDIVTFSHNAVYNVEAGSSSAGLDEGDQLTVRDCLYAMMLKSANEAANALAEHTAGTIEAFAAMMNAKAAALGCQDSHFCNPSGLNNPEHYTSAYDMALIAQAAFENEMFVEIDSTLYYDIPPSKRNPEGIRIYPGHKMLKKNVKEYYPGIIGGKTGYTVLAGNTLVTCAERDGMKLITVILNGYRTHYEDTKTLLDFGFANFKTLTIADYDTTYSSVENEMTIAGLPVSDSKALVVQKHRTITLPNAAEFADVESSIAYDLPAEAPEDAIARISYTYNERAIGSAYLLVDRLGAEAAQPVVEVSTAAPSSDSQEAEVQYRLELPEETTKAEKQFPVFKIPSIVWKVLLGIVGLVVVIAGIVLIKIQIEKKEEADRVVRYHRRQQRLQDIGMSTTEFDLLMQQRYTSTVNQPKGRFWRGRRKRKSFLDHKKQDFGSD